MFGRAAIRLGIGPHSSLFMNFLFIFKSTRLFRLVLALLRLREQRSPHAGNTRSTQACEDGAATRSSATGANSGYELSHCCQNARPLSQLTFPASCSSASNPRADTPAAAERWFLVSFQRRLNHFSGGGWVSGSVPLLPSMLTINCVKFSSYSYCFSVTITITITGCFSVTVTVTVN